MREVPIERNQHALRFAAALLSGRFDMMIFLAGVGTRALTKVVETRYRREDFVEALTKVTVVARGPKPIAALKELRVPIDVKVPEPNTWRTYYRRSILCLQGCGSPCRNTVSRTWH